MKRPLLLSLGLFAAGLLCGQLLQSSRPPVWAGPLPCAGGAAVDGDVNGDGALDLGDPVCLLNFLFLGGNPPVPCRPPLEPISVTVIVRHAEKASTGPDPGLTPEGELRAQELARVLAPAGAKVLIASDLRRTWDTLQPLADAQDLDVERIAEAEDVVKRIDALPRGDLAVVAHHSYTIPSILRGLGFEDTSGVDVSGDSYDSFLVVLRRCEQPPQLLHLRY